MTRVFKRPTLACGLVLVLAVVSGCQSFNGSVLSLFQSKPDVRWSDRENAAVRCLCLWQPAEGTWENHPCRGFGGQIFFLDRNGAKPVAVNGDVRIHVFDDQGPLDQQAKPIHSFDFTNGAWNGFLVKTQFGPAYNIFIPYTRSGAAAAECSIRVRLSGDDIPTVFSEMAYVPLEGTKAEDTTPNAAAAVVKTGKDGSGLNKTVSSSSILSPELQARLLALQVRKPVARKTAPARIDPPSTARPINAERARQPRPRHVIAAAHPLSRRDPQHSQPAFPRHPFGEVSTTNPPAERGRVAPSPPDPFLQMIDNAKSVESPQETSKTQSKAPGVQQASLARGSQARPANPSVLAPALEARLLALQARMPIPRKEDPARVDSPPVAAAVKFQSPGQVSHPPEAPQPVRGHDLRTGGFLRPMKSEPTNQPTTDRAETATSRSDQFQQMINSAEAAAARQDWDRAIHLASQVHRALVEKKTNWPGNRPSPSALVARWEVERITASAGTDRETREQRIDSRVGDYRRASQRQQEIGRESEARRLAMIGKLIGETGVGAFGGAHKVPEERRPFLAEGWSARALQASPPAHPLEPLDGNR